MLRKLLRIVSTLLLFVFICLIISSKKTEKNYSQFKNYSNFEKNSEIDINGLLNLDSTNVDIDIFKDKLTLIQFSFNGCSPCKNAKKKFPRLLNKTPKEFNIITISIDEFDYWKKLNKNENRWIKLNIGNSKIRETLKIKHYPSYFVVNSEGKIILRPNLGNESIRDFYNIEPTTMDLVFEYIITLKNHNRLWNNLFVCIFIYSIILGIYFLIKFLINRVSRRNKVR